MRCLWLTYADPEPRHNGQFVYSGGLIDAIAQADTEIEVLGLGRQDSPKWKGFRDSRAVWWLDAHRPLSRWRSLTSVLPHVVHRCRTSEMQRMLHDLLARDDWNGIVFDGVAVAWALPRVLEHYANRPARPRLIYISHNHEESLRTQVAESQGQFLRRQVVRLDALKMSRLERDLVDAVDYVTAI
ncbi:MAG TPA: hypothetical protein VJ890_17395, partial [Vineibacter sp.]|nr:hypothetical protein [Vineibacter sp.]